MPKIIDRAIIIVLDGAGIGASPDAEEYGDKDVSTIPHVAEAVGGLKLPNMEKMGLGLISPIKGVNPSCKKGAYGKMMEQSAGKDTTTGHWEIAGLSLKTKFPTYPKGFPPEIIDEFIKRTGRDVLGNCPASGTAIIEELGQEHLETGKLIVYTSADSVFQIAAHEDIVPIDELYRYSRIAREIFTGENAVGRIIARPFTGQAGGFKRTDRRKDFSLEPFGETILDKIVNAGLDVMAVGKTEDIFANKGISASDHVIDNMETVDGTLKFLKSGNKGLVFANLVQFDMNYGHRNDPVGFARALEEFDNRLPEIIAMMDEKDILIITADHGCDPTTAGTDHTREYVPLLVYYKGMNDCIELGTRSSFADIAATLAELFAIDGTGNGISFANTIGLIE